MIVRGVVEHIENDRVVILLSEEGHVVEWPRVFLPDVEVSDMLSFEVKVELPASEVKKINPKSLLERLAWRP
ncbi:MAG: hypothetical protein ACPLTR_02650 [Thermacetogeniaceae bacterium]